MKYINFMKGHKKFLAFTVLEILFFAFLLVKSIHPAYSTTVVLDNITGADGKGYAELPYGAYEVQINYEFLKDIEFVGMDFYMNPQFAPYMFQYSGLQIELGESSLTTLCWSKAFWDTETVEFGIRGYTDADAVRLSSVTFNEKISYRIVYVLTALALLMLFNFVVYYFFMKENSKNKNTVLGIAAITILSSLPFISDYMYDGHDLMFHMNRIVSMALGIREGNWRIYIQSHMLNGYGYATPIFYPQLFLYIPALLYSMYVPLYKCYYIYVISVNAATCIIAWYSFGKVAKNRKTAFTACAMYCLSIYRLMNVYARAAVGEYTAMAFFPLVLYGFYSLYIKAEDKINYKDTLPIIFGLSGIIQCHILSVEIIAQYIVVFVLVFARKTFRKKRFMALAMAAIVTFLLNIGVIYILFAGMKMNILLHHISASNIQADALTPAQIFGLFGHTIGTSNDSGTAYDMPFTPGIAILTVCVIMLWFVINSKRYSKKAADKDVRNGKIVLAFFAFSILLASQLFPWDGIGMKHFGAKLENILSVIQFPWRYMSMAAAIGSFACVILLNMIMEIKSEKTGSVMCAFFTVLILVPALHFYTDYVYSSETISMYSEQDCDSMAIGMYEYFPEGASIDRIEDGSDYMPEYDSEKISVENYNYSAGITRMDVVNDGDENTIIVPILNYSGYRAYDEMTMQELPIVNGLFDRVAVIIPKEYTGTVCICYEAPAGWKIAEAGSIIILLGLVGTCIYQKRKNIKNNS